LILELQKPVNAFITGKTFKDAGAWLAGKGFKPVKLELQALKNALKSYLNKEFSRLENIWVGQKKENQQKGSDAQGADKALKKAKPGTPEYEAALAKKSAAMVDPAKGTANGQKISSREQGWIDQIQDANTVLPRYVDAHTDNRLKFGTPLFLQAGVARNDTEISQRRLGDFSQKMNTSEFVIINLNLQIAVKVVYELNRILKG
jgi:hypothetical protein